MNITNQIVLYWSVEDPVYPYKGGYEFTLDELKAITSEEMLARQNADYETWLADLKQREQEQ
jgi:hypothetical protein